MCGTMTVCGAILSKKDSDLILIPKEKEEKTERVHKLCGEKFGKKKKNGGCLEIGLIEIKQSG